MSVKKKKRRVDEEEETTDDEPDVILPLRDEGDYHQHDQTSGI